MKKSKKGLTLVEVLVAITVLSITMFALLSTIVAMRKVVARQEEYVKIKMVCQDIEAYWDKYGLSEGENKGWANYYFDNDTISSERDEVYLTPKFELTNISKKNYVIDYEVTDNQLIIRSIESPDGKELVKGLNCGESQSASEEVTNEQ